jgi:large repetitive protein
MIGSYQSAWRVVGEGARRIRRLAGAIALAATILLMPSIARAVVLTVVGPDGTAVTDYRWLVEEDQTYRTVPGVTCAPGDDVANCQGASFHKSYMPVVAKGHSGVPADDAKLAGLDSGKRYFISVMPDAGYANGGAPLAAGQSTIQVLVQPTPLPTAQIRIFVFEDNFPINNAPDLPAEAGLPDFDVLLFEAGGTYGQSGGQVTEDCFGNQLGTTYGRSCSNNHALTCNTDAECGAGSTCALDANLVQDQGTGHFKTDADGYVVIRYLCPGKYTIQAVPPANQGWIQTATIEGTKGIDAWVKPNEPTYFQEFGPPGPHVFVGFVRQFRDAALSGAYSIRGQVRNLRTSRPPDATQFTGDPVPGCWVGLNEGVGGLGRALAAVPCDGDSHFEITGIPNGDYGLAVWDTNLDRIFASSNITINGQDIDFIDVPVFDWFAHYQGVVFNDVDHDGFRDPGEIGIQDAALLLRFRDGSIYQATSTDPEGRYEFREVFPFFNWLVAEVDFATKQATGATVVVDAGGAVPADDGWDNPSYDKLNPQPQCLSWDASGCVDPDPNPNTDNNLSRTETGPVLLEGFQGFLGQTHVIDWGKANYPPGRNGGITGIVHYATTRAENNPQYAAAENWEPGIPRVQINLYKDANRDGVIDNLTVAKACSNAPSVSCTTDAPCAPGGGTCGGIRSDVDNWPFEWRVCSNDPAATCVSATECGAGATCGVVTNPGPEDVDWNGNSNFDAGDALNVVVTDSWDDATPTGCQGDAPFEVNGAPLDCYDGLRNFGQVRPAVWDGGYAFWSVFPGGIASGSTALEYDDGTTIPAGTYLVEGTVPPGYDLVKEEDKNVDFGPEATPSPLLIPPACYGDQHVLPEFLTLFPDVTNPSNENPYVPGKTAPLCDRKQIAVRQGANAAVDFFLFTEVPVAGHMTGFILNDFANEADPNAPTFGEKYSPPFLPVSIRDWTGREISRVYADRWGNYNALVPSTYWISAPFPSGVSPNMMTACMNSPGPIPNPAYNPDVRVCSANRNVACNVDGDCGPGQSCVASAPEFVTDPYFDRRYTQFCYTLQYMPGKTTYLDTPVLPIAAYAGPAQFPVDCEWQSGTPVIFSVSGPEGGPYVPVSGQTITIVSAGQVAVPNPAYDEVGLPKTIDRDFGFGTVAGTVTIGGTALTNVVWNDDVITGTVANAPSSIGQLVVTRGDNGKSTEVGVTVYVGPLVGRGTPAVRHVRPSTTGWPERPIQAAIDAANPDDLILVAPGIYDENVIMWKPVRLQGWGAVSTVINAAKIPAERLQWWRDTVEGLINNNSVSLLPSQEIGFAQPEPTTLLTEEGPGILVLSKDANRAGGGFVNNPSSRIDGVGITGADHGGGIFVNGYAHSLQISNNRVFSNQGVYGGGIRVGHPLLTVEATDGELNYQNGFNDRIAIQHNQVIQNGSEDGAGGGISLNNGADSYVVSDNLVCGNFTGGDGAGIGHYGYSNNGVIRNNKILFNETFNQGVNAAGGGISIGGAPALPGNTSVLTPGAGSVQILSNLIQGNTAGAGDGGGIRLAFVNGREVEGGSASNRSSWYHVRIYNNIIIDNIAALAGGGISLQDAARVSIVHDTIVNNDSTATAGEAFAPNSPNASTPQVAGIVARGHSDALAAVLAPRTNSNVVPYKVFSNPLLYNDIIRNNRSFYFTNDPTAIPAVFRLLPDIENDDPAVIWDLSVQGAAGQFMNPRNCILGDDWQDPDSNPWTSTGSGNPYTSMVCSENRSRACSNNNGCRTCSGDRSRYCTGNGQCDAGQTCNLNPIETCELSNFAADPDFAAEYVNGNRGQTIVLPGGTTSIAATPAPGEGGNWITLRFGPLTTVNTIPNPDELFADQHVRGCFPPSPAKDQGGGFANSNGNPFSPQENLDCTNSSSSNWSPLCLDYDGEPRVVNAGVAPDIGADETTVLCPCSTDVQCDDGLACTIDTCNAGACEHASTCGANQTCGATSGLCEGVRSFQNGDAAGYVGTVDTSIGQFQNTIGVSGVCSANTTRACTADSGCRTCTGDRSRYCTQNTGPIGTGCTGAGGTCNLNPNGNGLADPEICELSSQAGTTAAQLLVDSSPIDHALIRFDSIFGPGANQIPVGATITSATLTLRTASGGGSNTAVNFHRLLNTWADADLYTRYRTAPWLAPSGIQAGTEAVAPADATVTMNSASTNYGVDVTSSLQAWGAAPSTNYGWVILPSGANDLRVESAQSATAGNRPVLTVGFSLPPAPLAVAPTVEPPPTDTTQDADPLQPGLKGGLKRSTKKGVQR